MKTGAKRNYTFYVLMLLIFGGLFWMVIREGKLWDRALGTLELYGDGFNSSSVLIYRYLLAVLMFAVVMLFRKESFKVKWGHLIRHYHKQKQ